MSNIINQNDNKFVDKHIGGNLTDTITDFNNQHNIIINNESDYQRLLNFHDKQERNKNKNDNYVERLDNELHATIFRLNNFPTYIDDTNVSNPLIYPKDYDMYFDYLNKKNINPINTQVVKKKKYINIDSSNRNTKSSLNIIRYINIKDNGLEFSTNTNTFKIYLDNSNSFFEQNNYIVLRGFKYYELYYENLNFFFTNNSTQVILDIKPNYSTAIPYYDIIIEIKDVTNMDAIYWKNIPLELINQIHKIYTITVNDSVRLAFDLPIKFYSDNQNDTTLISNCKITFYSLGNYPINLINANTPITPTNLSSYLTVVNVSESFIEISLTNTIYINNNIQLDGYWKDNSFFTGKNIQIGKIAGFIQGYPNPNSFKIFFNETYSNIAELKIISSEIPNVQTNINVTDKNISSQTHTVNNNLFYLQDNNNKLYWQNIRDIGIYSVSLDKGNYSFTQLKFAIEKKVSQIKRNFLIENLYLNEYNLMEVDFFSEINKSNFKLYDIFSIPKCLKSFEKIQINDSFLYKIKIYIPNHNLNKGDKIFISYSLDYYTISKIYLNLIDGHIVSNVLNSDYFEIIIDNINEIQDAGNTEGGDSIQIKIYAVFKMFFNFKDTFGSLIGFRLVGEEFSITNYTSLYNGYIISNTDPYYYNISTVLIVNNEITIQDLITDFGAGTERYILLLADGLNFNTSPNGPAYFYKFLLNGVANATLFNTFVNTPVYFNPPLKFLNELTLTFINSNGGLLNMGDLNYSFTLEITTLNNLPENTNISTNMSRI